MQHEQRYRMILACLQDDKLHSINVGEDEDGVTVTYEMASDDVDAAEAFASAVTSIMGQPDETGSADPGFYMRWEKDLS